MDLSQCADTFVGDDNVRGISGGQRRRVTVGEMMQGANPVACADEISTGLDSAVTYDIAFSIVQFAKAAKTTRIVSLLQPGPETFSLFDEVIVLSQGYVIYAGPIDDVVEYFEDLGYVQPERMDVADFLQAIPTQDGTLLFDPSKSPADEHYTSEEFAKAFKQSAHYHKISNELNSPNPHAWNTRGVDEEEGAAAPSTKGVPAKYKMQWQNSFWRATKLNFRRNFTLWKRDKGFIIGALFYVR
jgi:ABC-type multidrug transport system ATPase subunit